MEECGLRRIWCYSVCLFPGPDCISVQVCLWRDVSFLLSPSCPGWDSAGLDGSFVLFIRQAHFPYCWRNLEDVVRLSMEKRGRPKTLRIIVFMMKNFTWRVRSDKFSNYPLKQLSFVKWSFPWWKFWIFCMIMNWMACVLWFRSLCGSESYPRRNRKHLFIYLFIKIFYFL